MDRITKKQLESSVNVLNETLGLPLETYQSTRDDKGGLVANGGTFVLDYAYGGVALCRMCKGGGQSTVSGRGTMRDAHTYVSAMLAGIRAARESRQ